MYSRRIILIEEISIAFGLLCKGRQCLFAYMRYTPLPVRVKIVKYKYNFLQKNQNLTHSTKMRLIIIMESVRLCNDLSRWPKKKPCS